MTSSMLLALQSATGGAGGLSMLLFQIVAIGLVFWFLIIRPQSAARKKHAELLSQLKKGDEVMTTGGIIGVVREIRDVQDKRETRVTLATGTAEIIVERSRIVRIGGESAPGAATPA